MPPKGIRGSRLDKRQSLAIDSSIYNSPSINQDSDTSNNTLFNSNTNSRSTTSSTIPKDNSSNNNNGTVIEPPRRKSKRLSNDTPLTPQKFVATKSSSKKVASTSEEVTVKKVNKGKEVKKVPKKRAGNRDDEEEEEEEDEDVDIEMEEEEIIPKVKVKAVAASRNKKSKPNPEVASTSTSLNKMTGAPPKPRAAEAQGPPTKAPPKYDQALPGGDGGFTFTTNPPTPAPKKRPPPVQKENPRQKNSRTTTIIDSPTFDSDASPSSSSYPPIASTSKSSPYYSPARGSNTMAPIYTAETPKQMRNLALRGQGTASGTPGSAGRRGSVDRNRGKRASQIGNGQEALPHPDVANHTLYRLLDPLDPYTHRMRSLIRWTAHRQRDSMFPPPSSSGSSSKSASLSSVDLLAKQVIDEFISGISDRTISVNAEPSRDSRATSVPHVLLQQHEGNGKNRELYKHLLEDFDEIELEDSHRQTVVAQYDKFLNDHSNTLAKAALKSPAIDQLPISAEDSYPGPQSMEEALALGRALLAGNGDLKTGYRKLGIVPAAAAAKGKGKGKEIAGGELPEEDVLKESLAGIPLQSAHFKLLTHRLSTFTSLSTTYVQTRTQQTHQSLSEISQQGLLSSTSSAGITSSTGNTISSNNDPDYRGGIAGVIKGFSGAGSASTNRGGAGSLVANQSMDMRDLLRAIVSADLKR